MSSGYPRNLIPEAAFGISTNIREKEPPMSSILSWVDDEEKPTSILTNAYSQNMVRYIILLFFKLFEFKALLHS